MTSSASRSKATAAISTAYNAVRGSPLEQDELGAETGTHRHQHPGGPRHEGTLVQGVAQHVQNRGGREVADLVERTPGELQRVPVQTQLGLDGLNHLGAARMRHPGADVLDLQRVRVQERSDVVAEILRSEERRVGKECRSRWS